MFAFALSNILFSSAGNQLKAMSALFVQQWRASPAHTDNCMCSIHHYLLTLQQVSCVRVCTRFFYVHCDSVVFKHVFKYDVRI